MAEWERRAEETRRREEAEEKLRGLEKMLKDEMERKRMDPTNGYTRATPTIKTSYGSPFPSIPM